MKKTLKLVGFIALVAVIGFSIKSCKDPDPPGPFEGTWAKTEDSRIITFSGNNWVCKNGVNNENRGTFSYTETHFTLVYTDMLNGTFWDPFVGTQTASYTKTSNTLNFTAFSWPFAQGNWTKQ
ncbi:MAG: hypothetical protein FWD28_07925 [Treponema sp.]|nr:hypothetical protein [Treponema sp.]